MGSYYYFFLAWEVIVCRYRVCFTRGKELWDGCGNGCTTIWMFLSHLTIPLKWYKIYHFYVKYFTLYILHHIFTLYFMLYI